MRRMTFPRMGVVIGFLFAICVTVNAQRIGFLTHSVGSALYQEGNIAEWFTDYNSSKGTDFTIQRRSYPAEPYPWENNPYDYWNVWVNGACSEECFSTILEKYDIVIMKHCYTAARIEADINDPDIASDRKSVENYKLQYRAIRELFDDQPETKFIVFTLAPRHRLRTNATEAGRAKAFADWVKNEWLQEDGKEHKNIAVFDFWSHIAETDATPEKGAVNCIRYEYEKDHSSDNSHPNLLANETVAPVFARFIVDVANNTLVPTGNNDIIDDTQLKVNYSRDNIELFISTREIPGGSVLVTDLAGHVVHQQKTYPGESRIAISKNGFAGGAYIVRYTQSTGNTFTQKIVIR